MIQCSQYKDLVFNIIGAAMSVHRELNYGLLEAIYQEALHLELEDRGIANECEKEIISYYKHHLLEKRYKMDIVVEPVVVELKSVSQLQPEHRLQLINYLRLTKHPIGLLINFGEESLVAERWLFDAGTNECMLADKNLQPTYDLTAINYHKNIMKQ